MRKYAFKTTGNKKIVKQLVKDCQHRYNKNLAWYDKRKAKLKQGIRIHRAFQNWLHQQILEIIQQEVDHKKLLISSKTINPIYDEF